MLPKLPNGLSEPGASCGVLKEPTCPRPVTRAPEATMPWAVEPLKLAVEIQTLPVPGVEPGPTAMDGWSALGWTVRKVLKLAPPLVLQATMASVPLALRYVMNRLPKESQADCMSQQETGMALTLLFCQVRPPSRL